MLEVIAWAAEQFHRCLLDDVVAEPARVYLGHRKLSGETVRGWQLGYAPANGQWLLELASAAGKPLDVLEQVGLIGRSSEGTGYYGRFRDRAMFPIRDPRGRVVGFGGRILPSSANASRVDVPKYYNSAETVLFSKSENLYGIDQARQAGATAGCLAVVEGYTDVLMAHQMGICNVVATMGTALNARHVKELRKFAKRVVLVFDADAGGLTGVDRALEVFVSNDFELRVATLPVGLDPCDLLVAKGAEPLQAALTNAEDVLEFKLKSVLAAAPSNDIEGRRQAVNEVLRVIALAPEMPGQAGEVKRQLIVTRLSQRLGLKEETLWARLRELRTATRLRESRLAAAPARFVDVAAESKIKASQLELDLLRVLLADPELVPGAKAEVEPFEIEHPRLRLLVEVLYRLHSEGETPDLDNVRFRIDNPELMAKALELQEDGRGHGNRAKWFQEILDRLRERRRLPEKLNLQERLLTVGDHGQALDLLRKRQLLDRTGGRGDF
jgi:DNA primase